MLTRKQKEKVIDCAVKDFKSSRDFIFIDFAGLKVSDMQALKRKIKAQGAVFKAIKKTLANIVFNRLKLPAKVKDWVGSVAVIGVKEKNESAVAKEIYNFSKKSEYCKILGGIINNEFAPPNFITELAKLPPREVLLGRLAGAAAAPLRGLVCVLKGNLRGLVIVLSRIKK